MFNGNKLCKCVHLFSLQEYSSQITFREQWNDNRLQFDNMSGRIHYLVLTDPERIWKPDLFFTNEKTGHFHKIIMPNILLRIYPNGDVLYSIRLSLTLACPMDLKYYPLDRQTCAVKMASCKCCCCCSIIVMITFSSKMATPPTTWRSIGRMASRCRCRRRSTCLGSRCRM